MLVVYPLPDKGDIDNRYGVGVDCLSQSQAFGDASAEINRTLFHAFIMPCQFPFISPVFRNNNTGFYQPDYYGSCFYDTGCFYP